MKLSNDNIGYDVDIKHGENVIKIVSKTANAIDIVREVFNIDKNDRLNVDILTDNIRLVTLHRNKGKARESENCTYIVTIQKAELKANTIVQGIILDRMEAYGYAKDNPSVEGNTYYGAVRQVIKLRIGKKASSKNFYIDDVESVIKILDEILPRKGVSTNE